ncbi:asparaginyl-tRNA synthetase [Metarhizium acridum CQMa 102]|uniref:asparagine--tRNA ligase n=2 Tax=Metarhizium acridum TaxID=92637 RepID=E9E9T4_METAQ|nr:asparaginyl-tRNA synthetase [Metarhizium acridum CQMa 102]EFY87285.1 asparaginyl-tRNA synthetase [Metarhizium acridum CQMa 102]
MATIFIDEDIGKDEPTQQGTEESPFKTLQFAYLQHPAQAQYLTRKSESADDETAREWKPAAKSAMKKVVNYFEQQKKKAAREQELAIHRKKEEEERHRVLEEAKKIVLEEDPSLPKPVTIKLDEAGDHIALRKADDAESKGTRVRVLGRVHRERKQKDVLFVTLRDGYGFMQVVISGKLAKTYDALTLTRETSMEIFGEMREVPAGARAPLNRELHADFYKIPKHWRAVGGDDAITNRVTASTEHATLLDLRHLTLRGENASSVLLVRDALEYAFNRTYHEARIRKVSPPALVQTQVEGGSTLFKFDYYGADAFLTQSSQLYLETCLPSMGSVYCIEKSFRAEKSLTRRHLSEFTHIEAELDFIDFDDLLAHLESLICRVLELVLEDPMIAGYIKTLNPEFKVPERPFLRMKYSDAIQWLIDHDIPNEEGNPHNFGDDIAEAAERKMTDIINKPVFITHFPAHIKAFYMKRDPEDNRVTESVDCLMPGVGEIVGGSMRIDDYDELLAACKREGLDPEPYYWYIDQRK